MMCDVEASMREKLRVKLCRPRKLWNVVNESSTAKKDGHGGCDN